MFGATRLTVPAETDPEVTVSIMRPPKGAVPPIIDVMPMSAIVTRTTRPGREGGAEHVKDE
jgi:hypothetical protein